MKRKARIRRGLKTKALQKKINLPRLVVYRSGKHIYSQITIKEEKGDKILVCCSSKDRELSDKLQGDKTEKAREVGILLAARALKEKISKVMFDRNGYKFHGRVKALAMGVIEGGVNF